MIDSEKIIQMAIEAGAIADLGEPHPDMVAVLERFAAAIRAATKEEDARICEAESYFLGSDGKKEPSCLNCAEAIRASK